MRPSICILFVLGLSLSAQAWPSWPSVGSWLDSIFWPIARRIEYTVVNHANSSLDSISKNYDAVNITLLTLLKNEMSLGVITSATEFRRFVEDSDVSFDEFSDHLSHSFQVIYEEMQAAFPNPDQAPSHADRDAMIDQTLARIGDALVVTCVQAMHLPEEQAREHWEHMRPHIHQVLVTTGDLVEQHPKILGFLLLSVAGLLLPEFPVLRPILSLFGFGPYGPIKGSAAAWAQRYFWGGAVEAGSWFAWLQATGMTMVLPVVPGTTFPEFVKDI